MHRCKALVFVTLLFGVLPTLAACVPVAELEQQGMQDVARTNLDKSEEQSSNQQAATSAETSKAPAASFVGQTLLGRVFSSEWDGSIVTAIGQFNEVELEKFNAALADFEFKSGIDIQYEIVPDLASALTERIEAGNPPDLVAFSQPSLVAQFAQEGHIVDLNLHLDMQSINANYDPFWLDLAQVDGPEGPMTAGVWGNVNSKSLVWYPKAAFDSAGYTVPQSWDELIQLTDAMVANGHTPWCIGIEAGERTGWPATDWLEDILLRTAPLEVYDSWTQGELSFTSPEVTQAAEIMAQIWLNNDYILGGQEAIGTTSYQNAALPMLDEEPQCWLHKQGNFILDYFPEDAVAGTDFDFFPLPAIDETYGTPNIVGGTIWASLSTELVDLSVLEYFSRGEHMRKWLAASGTTSPHLNTKAKWYGTDVDRRLAELLTSPDGIRFDGSDLMLEEATTQAFSYTMAELFNGNAELAEALSALDAAMGQ